MHESIFTPSFCRCPQYTNVMMVSYTNLRKGNIIFHYNESLTYQKPYDTQQNGIQLNDTDHNDIQHNDAQHNNKQNVTLRMMPLNLMTQCHHDILIISKSLTK